MNIETNVSLKNLTTFKIGGAASYFALVETREKLLEAISFADEKKLSWFILGGGSNVLVSDEGYKGLVIKLAIKGIDFKDLGDTVEATVGAGESWDGFVETCVSRSLYGIENLSAIPGTVGAAPVQNIGAYGMEVKDAIRSVVVCNTECLTFETLNKEECRFGYRDSIFKKPEGKKYSIVEVVFELKKKSSLVTSYKDVAAYFERLKKIPTLTDVRAAIIEIRKGKFPDLNKYGTAGSFFKNPIITREHYQKLLLTYPAMPHYPVGNCHVKIPLAWILDNVCNIKGARRGDVGSYPQQALVLVNWGNATAVEVKAYAQEISSLVKSKSGIDIEPEVQYM